MTLKDKNGAEIRSGDWFVFVIQDFNPRIFMGFGVPLELVTTCWAPDEQQHYTFKNMRGISYSLNQRDGGILKCLLVPKDIRDLGLKAVVSYLHLGGLEVPNGINQLINEDNPDEE